MRGQSSAEMLILIGAILLVVTSLFYLSMESSEMATITSAARAGAENAIADLDFKWGCSIDIESLGFDDGRITIYVNVRGGPPPDNQAISDNIRESALKYIHQAVTGFFSKNAEPFKTSHYTYDVNVGIRRVRK